MSEQQPETGAPDESGAPDEHEGDEPTPDEAAPGESPETITEEDEAHESEEVEGQQGDQGEQEPPEAQALSQKQLEQALGKLEREAERHSKRVGEIMGSEVELLLTCPLCDPLTPGQIMPTPATPERFPAVREFMGDAQPQEWQQDPNTHTCQTCDGMGEVKTGSKVKSQATLVCTDCGGKGWQGARAPIVTSGPMAVQPLPDANGHTESGPPAIDPPEIADLKRRGYTIIEPVKV